VLSLRPRPSRPGGRFRASVLDLSPVSGESSARRPQAGGVIALCVVGNHVAEIHKFFDIGPACRGCVLKATRIEASYTIFGNIYSESLK
jgi:hypothetical protein